MQATEYETAEPPAAVREAKAVHLEDLGAQVDSLHQRIASGKTFLKVVAYPWGVEFDICEGENER